MTRTILHLDLDAFYCSVEELRNPELVDQPFAVGGRPEQRGVVASCSYPARCMGVRSAMPMSRALALCPQMIVVPVQHADYRAVSRKVMAILRATSPLVEQLSIDEAFLDVSHLVADQGAEADKEIALRLQRRIRQELGLSCSVGVASNKMVAKIATDQGKAAVQSGRPPGALCVVPAGEEESFLAPLPVSALWGVGPKTAEQLAALGATTIAELAQRPLVELINRFGRHGYHLARHARGIDRREIETSRDAKSISSETTFARDVGDWDVLAEALEEQATDVARQLQRQGLRATTVKIKLRWSDFSTPSRQLTLSSPTADTATITESAVRLLDQLWQEQQRLDRQQVRLLGVGVSGLQVVRQLSLWNENGEPSTEFRSATSEPADEMASAPWKEKRRHLEQAVAELEERYGERIIVAGKDLL